jgi:hypothetical protein
LPRKHMKIGVITSGIFNGIIRLLSCQSKYSPKDKSRLHFA